MNCKKRVLLITPNKNDLKTDEIKEYYCIDFYEIHDIYYMTKEQIVKNLTNMISTYDLIIIPGNIIWDFSDFNGKIVKGTESLKYFFKLLKYINLEELSPKLSADKIHKDKIERILNDIKKSRNENPLFKIKNLEIYKKYPLRIFGEIFLYKEERIEKVLKKVNSYIDDGIDAIILGVMPSISYSYLRKLILSINEITQIPIGLDGNIRFLKEFNKKVDILMSFTIDSFKENISWLKDNVSVLLVNKITKKALNEIKYFEDNKLKIIVDPIAYPLIQPGFLNTLIRAKKLSTFNMPIMLGINNVSELIDADSTGVNALSAFLASESGVSILLTGESSVKNRGAILELKRSAKMVEESIILDKPPKDLSIDMLALKEKDWQNNGIKVFGERDEVYLEFKDKKIKILCKNNCPIKELSDEIDKESLIKISILIYRYCSPWSMNWDC